MTAVLAALVLGALLVAGSALAGGTPGGYQQSGNGVEGTVQKGATSGTPSKTVGTLPFTGLDLGLFAGGALMLVFVGASLRRVARRSS
jgi:hypothetical protein